MRIYVAGHRGLVGSAICEEIDSSGIHSQYGYTRQELDLLDRKAVFERIKEDKPDAVIIAAAKVGGIRANQNYPVEFLTENLQIQCNLMDAAHNAQIKKVLFLGSSCIYPKFADQPIQESALLTGKLEPTNEAYALAKIAGIKLINSYREEYGHNWISAMPTNVYGPRDNFDIETSHVLPALIRKLHDAKILKKDSIQLWGSGEPLREFIHASDLARACIFLLENFDNNTPINVGSGQELKIRNLASIIQDVVGFSGDLMWDKSMPDGTPRKALDSSLLFNYGWSPKVKLEEGISSTYKWFLENYA